jgi:hypothetical protein
VKVLNEKDTELHAIKQVSSLFNYLLEEKIKQTQQLLLFPLKKSSQIFNANSLLPVKQISHV